MGAVKVEGVGKAEQGEETARQVMKEARSF